MTFGMFLAPGMLMPSLDIDTTNWLSRLTARPSLPFAVAHDNWIFGGKQLGWYQKQVLVYFLHADTIEAITTNVRGPWNPLVVSGAPEYNFGAWTAGNKIDAFFVSNALWSDMTTRADALGIVRGTYDMNQSVYYQTDRPEVAYDLGVGAGTAIQQRGRNSSFSEVFNMSTTFTRVGKFVSAVGFRTAGRNNDATAWWGYRAGGIVEYNQPFEAFPGGGLNASFQLFRTGLSANFSRQGFSFVAHGFDGDPNHHIAMATLSDQTLTTLGAFQPDPEPPSVAPPHAFGPGAMAQCNIDNVLRISRRPLVEELTAIPQAYAGFPCNHFALSVVAMQSELADPTLFDRSYTCLAYIGDDRAQGMPGGQLRGSWSSLPITTSAAAGSYQARVHYLNALASTGWDWSVAAGIAKFARHCGLLPFDDLRRPDHRGWVQLAKLYAPALNITIWENLWATNPNDPAFTGDSPLNLGPMSCFSFWNNNADTVFTNIVDNGTDRYKWAQNITCLDPFRICDFPNAVGIMLDAERFDNIPPSLLETIMQERRITCDATGMKFWLTGPGPGQGRSGTLCGFTLDNGNRILVNSLDHGQTGAGTRPPGGSARAYIEQQIAGWAGEDGDLPVPTEKLFAILGIGGTNVEMSRANALECNDVMVNPGTPSNPEPSMWGAQIVPLFANLGGPPTNEANEVQARFCGLPPGQFIP